MSNAAERFYQASHELNVGGRVVPALSSDEAAAELSRPSHRYHCAYKFLQQARSGKVVELGFGSPRLLGALADGCDSYTVVDIADRVGGVTLPGNVHFRKADLSEDFPFPDESFDCSIAMMIIEHLFDPFHSFREVARITRRGGKVFVNLPNIGSIRCRLQLLAGRMPVTSSKDWFEKREWDGNHLHYFTVSDTEKLAAASELRLDALHAVGQFGRLKALRPSLLCHEISFEFTRL
ncbi:MAG: class I SAM-dependent methyltransferase [Panacagrimonas sp.]